MEPIVYVQPENFIMFLEEIVKQELIVEDAKRDLRDLRKQMMAEFELKEKALNNALRDFKGIERREDD